MKIPQHVLTFLTFLTFLKYKTKVGSIMPPKKKVKIEFEDGGPSSSSSSSEEKGPLNWRKVLENIQEMRKEKDAPVDSMGCERTMEKNIDEKTRRYQCLVSLMLSSQTRDQVTSAAMERLQKEGLTVEKMIEIDEGKLAEILKPVGFYKRKADYIKRASVILRDKFQSDIPDDIENLVSLPGVGNKMGYIALHVAWGKCDGIGVDVHVHRICNRLGWVKTKTPEETRKSLESFLPKDLWQEINILLVGFGQTICSPVGPKCGKCLNKAICPEGKKYKKS